MHLLLLVHVAATLIMLGVILVVQVVHYPLFGHVGAEGYAAYQAEHMRRITVIVLPVMTVELATAVALVCLHPTELPAWMAWTGLVLVGLIWCSTALLQVPLHRTLCDGFDAATHRRLVATNWIRTGCWGARGVLALWMVALLLGRSR